MPRLRFRIVLILLVLILVIVSMLFGVLTYWLDAEVLPTISAGPEGRNPQEAVWAERTRSGAVALAAWGTLHCPGSSAIDCGG
jgi:hypothetical protein